MSHNMVIDRRLPFKVEVFDEPYGGVEKAWSQHPIPTHVGPYLSLFESLLPGRHAIISKTRLEEEDLWELCWFYTGYLGRGFRVHSEIVAKRKVFRLWALTVPTIGEEK